MNQLKERQVLDGRFQILKRIGEGGMGTVHLAEQLGLGRKVAIKTLNPEYSGNEDLVARFRREAHIIQNLTHPNTVRLYDFGETPEGHIYIVMEYLEGWTLDQVLAKRRRMPVQTVVDLAKQVLGSLIEAHAQGIVHRDLKPSNLMLCEQIGVDTFVKVLDFGLARADIEQVSLHTYSGAVMGTPHYMSPEQARGHRVGSASDLYSLSLTLFELVMGAPAYQASSPYELAMNHLTSDPLPIPSILAATRLGHVIKKGAEKSLEDRYQSAEDMLDDLTNPTRDVTAPRLELSAAAERDLFGEDGDTEENAALPESIPPTGEWPGKRRWKLPVLSVGALLLVAVVGGVAFLGDDSSQDGEDHTGAEASVESDSTEAEGTPAVVDPQSDPPSAVVGREATVAATGEVAAAVRRAHHDAQEESLREEARETQRERDSRRDRDRRRDERERTAAVPDAPEEGEVEAAEPETEEQEELAAVEQVEEPVDPPEPPRSEVEQTPSLMEPVVGPSDGGEPSGSAGTNERPSELPINF